MAQIETTGGGYLDSGDRRTIRKVYVKTDGGSITLPASESGYPLTNVNVSEDVAGLRRAVAEYSQGGEGGASYNQYGKRIELVGGTREVPILNHPAFSLLTPQEVQEVETAVESKTQGPFPSAAQTKLFSFLVRGVEYFMAPAVVGRITEIESSLPSLSPIAKVADPSELNAPADTFWVCTAVTASPIGSRYEVTREYTLTFTAWEDVETLYSW
jgi:hypothetical protein